MKQTEDTTPEQYRAELIDEKQRLQAELVSIKSKQASAFIAKDQQLMAQLSSEKAEIVSEIAEIDSDLRQLKQELQQSDNSISDLSLIVQLVAAEIAHSGTYNVKRAVTTLNAIKETLINAK